VKARVVLLFALLVLVVYADPLFLPRTFGGRDLPAYNFPMEKAVHDAYARGRLPAWAEDVSGGRPLLANPNAGALYPVRILLSAVPFEAAVKIYPVFHWILAGAGMAFLLGACGLSFGGQWIGAVTYAFSGIAVSEVFFPHIQPGMMLLPWILWAVCRPASRVSRLLSLSILFGLDVLAGDVFTVTMGLAAGLLWIALEEPVELRKGLVVELAAAVGLGLLLAAPQVVATALWIPETHRGVSGITLAESLFFSLSPWRLLEFVIPFPFGRTASLDEAAVWGRVLFHEKGVGLFATFYAGALPVLALLSRPRPRERGCRFARALFFASLAACVLPTLLPSGLEAKRSPIALRNPEKLGVLCVLALSVLAAWTLEIRRRQPVRQRGPLLVGLGLTVAASAAFLWPARAGAVATRLIGAPRSSAPTAAESLSPALAEAGLLWMTTLVAMDLLRLRSRSAAAISLSALTVIPIASSRAIAQSFPAVEVFSRTAFERRIERADPSGRYRTLGESIYRPASPLQYQCQRTDPTYTDYARRSWTQHTHALWNRGTVFNYDFDNGDLSRVESLRRFARHMAESGDPRHFFASLALRFGVRFRDQAPLPGYRRVGGDLLQDWDENPESLPDVRLLPTWRGEPDAVAALKDLALLSEKEAVLETGSRGLGSARPGRIALLEDTPEQIRLETESLDPGWLFVLRPFWTHRTIEVDGRLVEPVAAQLAFTAVAVSAGRHTIRWRERVPGGAVSRWGPVFFGLFALGLSVRARRRARR
jgi:hypothetical protein